MQAKRHSAIESMSNVAIGFFLAYALQLVLMRVYGIPLSAGDNLVITVFFMVGRKVHKG